LSTAGSADITWFNSYHAYADHMQFLTDLQAAYPNNSEIVVAGNSNAGRPITGIHFYGSGGKGSKPAVVLHGTVHAREWITTMVRNDQSVVISRRN
jgi:carboxypeptidase A4